MPMSENMLRPFASFWADEKPAPKTSKPAMSQAERARKERSDYLVSLSRKSPRGQAFAKRQDELRAMVRRAKETTDPYERNAIINAMRNQGMIDE